MTQRIMHFLKGTGDISRRVVTRLHHFYGGLLKFLLAGFRRQKGNASNDDPLKKKNRVVSAEAALVSIGFHVLLLVFAGSIVAVHYVQKMNAEFVSENIERPKLERRQLQMPVKMQNLQKKSQRPKVTTRMATAASSTFALPDMAGMGQPGQAGSFARVNTGNESGGRDLSKMGSAGSLGFGASSVNFFGAKSSGEKIVFVISASKWMVEDGKGGFTTYKFVKDRINQMVSGMKAATLFNVVLYNQETSGKTTVAVFSPQLVPASQAAKKQLLAWLEPINTGTANIGKIPANYNPPVVYESDIAKDAATWLKAVQAAMEQGADNIFVLCAGWEIHTLSGVQREKLFGWSAEKVKKFNEDRGWPPARVAEYYKKIQEIYAKGREILAKENAARVAKGLPLKVVQNDWIYCFDELKFPRPEPPPASAEISSSQQQFYRPEHVINHLDAVYQYNYVPKKLEKPKINFVCLIDEDGRSLTEGTVFINSTGMDYLRKVAGQYRGGLEYLRGAKTMESLLGNNPGLLDKTK